MSLPKPYYDDGNGIVIYNSDCREILPLLSKVDLVLTDPPYGIDYDPAMRANIGAKQLAKVAGDTEAPDIDYTILRHGHDAVIWGANNFPYLLPKAGRWAVWDKRVNPDADCIIGCPFELAWTTLDSGWGWMFRIQHAGFINADGVGLPRVHPTQKPIKLMTACMGLFPKAQTILDPFMGSGSTLVAAKQLGRKCIGIEIERAYCDIAIERLAQAVFSFDEPQQVPAEIAVQRLAQEVMNFDR